MMTPHRQLQSNVHQLVNEHTERHTSTFRHEGSTFTEQGHGTEYALIAQLRYSIRSSMADAKGGASSAKQSPINAAALSLYERISDQAAREYVALSRREPKRTVEGNIRAWMSWSLSSDRLTETAAAITGQWVNQIKLLLNPRRTVEIIGACPSCGYSKQWMELDGEKVLTSLLIATGDTVTCQSPDCGASWSGADLHWLKEALDTGAVAVA